jgi:hypothetical protein
MLKFSVLLRREINLIIMGIHEKSDFERRLLGGTIEKVVLKAPCLKTQEHSLKEGIKARW